MDISANTIYAFRIDATTGALTAAPGPPIPGGTGALKINPSGTVCYVINNAANTISTYAIDGTIGALTRFGGIPVATSGDVTSVSIASSGAFAYAVNSGSQNIDVFAINSSNGAFSSLGTSFQATAGALPGQLTIHPSGKFAYVPATLPGTNMGATGVSAFTINTSTGL